MSFIDFESAREKEKKRQWEREARNAVLEKAKKKYEADQLLEEERRQRGEHTWMLPSVEAKLDSASSKKKKKKEKKKKKKKKAKKRKESSSSSSSDSEENETWVEKPQASLPNKPAAESPKHAVQTEPSEKSKRDGWMEMTSLFKTYSRDEIREKDGTSRKKEKEEEKRRKQEADKPGSHALELNPYYKDGGTGLPDEEQKSEKSSSPAIGFDATWLRKALQRAKEQAQTENKSLEEIAAQRWGSLAKFNELLAEAEGKTRKTDRNFWQTKSRSSETRHRYQRRSGSRESRSKSRERLKYSEKDRRRSRSRDRISSRKGREESKDGRRGRSRSRSREKRRSVDKDTSRSRDRRSRSKDRRSRSRDRRSRSNERQSDSQRKMDKSKEKSDSRRRYSRSSGSSSDSGSDSSFSSRDSTDKNKYKSDSYKNHPRTEGSQRTASGFMKPPSEKDTFDSQKSSLLSSKFHRPGEDIRQGSKSRFDSRGSSGSSQGWRKKDHIQEAKKQELSDQSSSSSSESESSEEEHQPPESVQKPTTDETSQKSASETPVVLTDKEMNELAAKIMKAELIGNDNLASKLKSKLEAARNTRSNAPKDSGSINEGESREEVVVLTRTDARGFSRPVTFNETETGTKKKGKMKTHGKDGKRVRYFPDDEQHDLKQMFEAEKTTTAEDQNSMFNRAAMQNTERLNEDYDMDDMFMSKAVMKESSAKQAERDKKRAIQDHHRSQRSLESCQWCFENKEMAKHLIVALGTKAYVCLPPHQSLTPGHCLIIPIHHVMCSVQADEDLWSEVMSFRKSLVRMFASRDEDCIFFETAKRLRNFPHMVLNCVPLPKEVGDMAPIYFKKAIMECELEWSQNKKLVELKNRDVRKAVPKGLPYFFVDFAMDPGYAHVIEDEQEFPHNFAQEIVGGVLDLDNNLWRKPRKENFDAQRRKVMEFSRWYKEYDITQDDKS